MLIYSNEPLNVMMKNILLLDDLFTGGYVYVNKETYDQALSLSITFNQDIGRVKQTISGKGMLNWAANAKINHVVSLCAEHFAQPLNMLAPYLAYTLPIGVEWPDEDEDIIKMAYGVLNQMSGFTNFYGTALMPAGAKAEITIPKNIIMAYEDSWKAQLDTLDKCVVAVPVYIEGSKPASTDSKGSLKEMLADPEIKRAVDSNIEISDITDKKEETVENDADEEVVEDSTGDTESTEETSSGDEKVVSSAEEQDKESSDEEDGDEGEEDDMEAKILAMMKAIEDAPSESFQPKEEERLVTSMAAPTVDKKSDAKENRSSYGDSGSINLTEQEIIDGNNKLLNDYDI